METISTTDLAQAAQTARFVRDALPPGGLFAGQSWRISPTPFPLGAQLAKELESLGRVLLQFYRATNLLYRRSLEGKQPDWVARWLDQGKPDELIERQRHPAFKQDLPRVIRPDILLTEDSWTITELDSVPGGIGLTAWLNQTYSNAERGTRSAEQTGNQPAINHQRSAINLIGGARGMLDGFASLFADAPHTHIVVSEEAATYRPEMEWLASQLGASFSVHGDEITDFLPNTAVYRFFELFDLANVENADRLLDLAAAKWVKLTPPPKPIFEEKMLFALLWNRNLAGFWRQELGESFLERLKWHVPYTWLMDPTPLPPHGAIPELNLTDWNQLKLLSQRERELILKVSGFSPNAWGARGVFLGSDLSQADWSAAVDQALASFGSSPHILQRFHKPRLTDVEWFDFDANRLVPMKGRVRLCPYYFVSGDWQNAQAKLGGVMATIVPADKKIVHGMTDAVLAPCCV